jgi:putative selenium metabolism hydrolase
MSSIQKICSTIDKRKQEIIEFTRSLIQTPSPTGQEAALADMILQKFKSAGLSSSKIDPVGNVVGILKGIEDGKSFILNGHMDHVPPSEMPDPYSAKIMAGETFGVKGPVVYGRGASDMKGALGAMVMAGCILNDLGITMKGDLILAGTVYEEELGNIGPPALIDIDHLHPDAALIGECTNLDLAYGNRGVVRTTLTTHGKSCHVSVQERGINALYKMTKIINKIQTLNNTLPRHPILGQASWAICRVNVQPNIANVVPDRCEVEIDTRSIPNFSLDSILAKQQDIIDESARNDSEFTATLTQPNLEIETWTGYKTNVNSVALPFFIDPNHWLVTTGKEVIEQVTQKNSQLKVWGFTTECYCFTERGIPVIGIGPGEEQFTHSNNDVVSVADVITATKIYALLAAKICSSL